MAGINERWEAQQRSRWMRPDAARYLRPDIERYFTPAVWQAMTPAQRGQLSGAGIERKGHVVTERSVEDLQRERCRLARQKLELLKIYDLHLRLKAQLYSEKYSPNQPRVPKGNPDGGQWTSDGGGSGRGGHVQVADLRSGRGRINDRRVISDADPEPPLLAPTAMRYRDPNDPLGLNKWRLEGGGGGGRGGFGSSPPSYSTGGGAVSKQPSSARGVEAATDGSARFLTVKEAGASLTQRIGRNRVSIMTPSGRIQIDLAGKSHYVKSQKREISPPHVTFQKLNVSPSGRTNLSRGTPRPATMLDIRMAREMIERWSR